MNQTKAEIYAITMAAAAARPAATYEPALATAAPVNVGQTAVVLVL
jgi:hypothetical protein